MTTSEKAEALLASVKASAEALKGLTEIGSITFHLHDDAEVLFALAARDGVQPTDLGLLEDSTRPGKFRRLWAARVEHEGVTVTLLASRPEYDAQASAGGAA